MLFVCEARILWWISHVARISFFILTLIRINENVMRSTHREGTENERCQWVQFRTVFFPFFSFHASAIDSSQKCWKKLWPEHSTVWCERWTFGVAAKTITFMNNGHTPRNKYQNAIFSKFYIAFFNGCSEKRAVEWRAERNFTATNKYFQNGVFHGTANDEMTENNNSVWMMCVWNFSLFAVCWSAKRQALKPQNTTIIIFMFIIETQNGYMLWIAGSCFPPNPSHKFLELYNFSLTVNGMDW